MEAINEAVETILQSKSTIALTGAGVSVESGIPDFRSKGGLWTRFDPSEYATIEAFTNNPSKVWEMLHAMNDLVDQAEPNKAHIGMADMEKMGLLQSIITQNVDNLHQEGGSANVIEYHGNSNSLSCLACGKKYVRTVITDKKVPLCECGRALKPDVIFFGEAIPVDAMNRSFELASSANALIVAGTSALVYPANTIPMIAKKNNAKIIEINIERTHLTDSVTDFFLEGSAGDLMEHLVEKIRAAKNKSTS